MNTPDSFHPRKTMIRHLDKPSCIHCKYYLPDVKKSFSSSSGKCQKFGGKDLHTGIILYDYADSVRQDESKCTVSGKYFVGEKNLLQKKMVYTIQQILPYVLFLMVTIGV